MAAELVRVARELVEADWPNHREILMVWLPKSTVMVYNAEDGSHLSTLLSRIPKEWSDALVVDFNDWFKLPDVEKEQYVGKHVIMTRYTTPNKLTHVPGILFFLPYAVIMETTGRFTDIRDQSGWKWGDFDKRILSTEVLNGSVTL